MTEQAVAIPHSLTVNTMDTSAPQGADVLYMISPWYIKWKMTSYVNQAIDSCFGDELTLSLEFSVLVLSRMSLLTISFYKRISPSNPIPITLSPSGTLTKQQAIVNVVISGMTWNMMLNMCYR